MKKSYSKKERQSRKFIRNIFISFIAIILVIVFTVLITNGISDNERIYTAEEMSHDHDGDGVPDH